MLGFPTVMCRHHSLADYVAGLEVMAPPIPFYLTQYQTYSCLSVVGLPIGSNLHMSDPTVSNTSKFRVTIMNVQYLLKIPTTARNSAWPNHLAWGLTLLMVRCMMMWRLGWLSPHSCITSTIKAATDAPWVCS